MRITACLDRTGRAVVKKAAHTSVVGVVDVLLPHAVEDTGEIRLEPGEVTKPLKEGTEGRHALATTEIAKGPANMLKSGEVLHAEEQVSGTKMRAVAGRDPELVGGALVEAKRAQQAGCRNFYCRYA